MRAAVVLAVVLLAGAAPASSTPPGRITSKLTLAQVQRHFGNPDAPPARGPSPRGRPSKCQSYKRLRAGERGYQIVFCYELPDTAVVK